jgi:hypothetical protein
MVGGIVVAQIMSLRGLRLLGDGGVLDGRIAIALKRLRSKGYTFEYAFEI